MPENAVTAPAQLHHAMGHDLRWFDSSPEVIRLVGAILLEQNDEWAVQRSRYMTLETLAPLSDDPLVSMSIPAS